LLQHWLDFLFLGHQSVLIIQTIINPMSQGAKFRFLRSYSNFIEDFASWKIFLFSYAGLLLSIVGINLVFSLSYTNFSACQVSLQCLGAAAIVAIPSVPAWGQGYAGGNVGGLLEAMLHPLGNFGQFLTVLLSLSVTGANVVTFYSISINLQVFMPILATVPRYVFSVVATAM
jgi:purine-cytosine permease-like protein